MPSPANLPYPVVFGPSFPDFTMVTQHGRQTFRSRTNQNLFLTDWDFTDKGTFTMANLLKKTATHRASATASFGMTCTSTVTTR